MKDFVFESELWLPHPCAEIFPFFAEARNLEAITPPWLRFEVLTPAPIEMRRGTLIDYRLQVHGIPIRWQTEIVEWQPPHGFVDVQRRGPYVLWHHSHSFEEHDHGTRCRDSVRYRPRGGAWVNWLFVRRDVEAIFRYRQHQLKRRFGYRADTPPQPDGTEPPERLKALSAGAKLRDSG